MKNCIRYFGEPTASKKEARMQESAVNLANELILCVSERPWHNFKGGRQKISRVLARNNDVLYVDPPQHVRALFRPDARPKWRLEIEQVEPRLHVLRFPAWAGEVYREPVHQFQVRQRVRLTRRAIRQLGWQNRRKILLLVEPTQVEMAEHLRADVMCYHVQMSTARCSALML